ncbi:MAG: cytochrome b [Hyphomicrobiales bacterium]|nr:cytochrome b [Hyphomicrobiales bacterium]
MSEEIVMSQHSTYVPRSAFAKWFESRLPIAGLVHSSFIAFPVPRNLTYFWTFGAILMFMLVAQIVTGVVLAMHYVPDTRMAFDSVESIMRDVNYGWLLRYLHANGASMFFIAVYIHIFRGLYYGSYKAPREVLWLLGVIIFLLMMATAFMGFVLPWGQMSFWGATVITNLFSAIPLVGNSITTWLWGGYSVDNPTLNRFFSLHYLLPFMIMGVVILHVWALHVSGQNNPTGIEVKNVERDTVPFTPYATIKDGFAMVCFLAFYSWFVFYVPNVLGHADNYIQANPLVTPAHIVPEWYFLPFYAILRAVPDKLGGVIAMFSAIAVLAFLPWLDTSRVKSASYRPVYKVFFWVFVLVCIGLGYLGAMPAEGGYVTASRILMAYYFGFFLIIMPLLGLFETPKPLPASIADSVLARGGSAGSVAAGAASAPDTKS